MYELINQLLAKQEPYTEVSWQHQPLEKACLRRVENILQQLKDAELLPAETHDGLVHWLLHKSPLSQMEIADIRKFAFEIDRY